MQRLTLGQLRKSVLAQTVGQCTGNLAGVAAIVNEAQERLLHDPTAPDEGWWGGWVSMVFNLQVSNFGAYVTTPMEVARLININVCQKPVFIRNGFYEYLMFGAGNQPLNCGKSCSQKLAAYERDNVYTLSDMAATPQLIRLYPNDAADVGQIVIIQGLDRNRVPVTSLDPDSQQTIQGEAVSLQLPFSTTVNEFIGPVAGIQKPVTIGRVSITQVDPTTLAETALSSMEPGEQAANYRRYFINGLPRKCCSTPCGTVQIETQAKLDFVPAMSDPDYLLIQSLPALIEEVQSIRYSRIDSESAAKLEQKHHIRALSLLNGQLDHFLGKVNTSVFMPIFGSDRLTKMPI